MIFHFVHGFDWAGEFVVMLRHNTSSIVFNRTSIGIRHSIMRMITAALRLTRQITTLE